MHTITPDCIPEGNKQCSNPSTQRSCGAADSFRMPGQRSVSARCFERNSSRARSARAIEKSYDAVLSNLIFGTSLTAKIDPFFCVDYKKYFHEVESLRQHLDSPAHPFVHTCNLCGRIFYATSALNHHLASPLPISAVNDDRNHRERARRPPDHWLYNSSDESRPPNVKEAQGDHLTRTKEAVEEDVSHASSKLDRKVSAQLNCIFARQIIILKDHLDPQEGGNHPVL